MTVPDIQCKERKDMTGARRFLSIPNEGTCLMPNTGYDVLVIGGGPAGENAADVARKGERPSP